MARFLKTFALVAVAAALLIGGWLWWTQYSATSERPSADTEGPDPVLVDPDPQTFPGLSLPKPVGWSGDAKPVAAQGLVVTPFATGLDHPRTMLTLPNGDVLVAETNAPPKPDEGGVTGWFMKLFMSRVGAAVPSPDRVVLLRDGDGDGKAEQRFTFRTEDMASPSGMAFGDGRLYIANHDAVLAWTFEPGPTKLEGKPRRIMNLAPAGNHWMRNLKVSADGKQLYVGVGSASNIAEKGMEAERGRAAIFEIDTDTGKHRAFAAGMRNPNGMDWNPSTGELWATVQERDMLGSDLVPDYLTNVPVGVQYGWPWVYWKDHFDDRVEWDMPIDMTQYTRKPEYAMGAHTAVLGLVFARGGERMGPRFANGAFVARHGSWNRRPAAGYDVVFVPFDANGNPTGARPVKVLAGFLDADQQNAKGRPTWLAWDKTGALLVSDDTGGVIWRVSAPGARPSAPVNAVKVKSMPPQTEIKDPTQIRMEDLLRAGT